MFDQNGTADRANGHRTMTALHGVSVRLPGATIRGSDGRSRPSKLPFPSRCSQIAYAGPRATRIVVVVVVVVHSAAVVSIIVIVYYMMITDSHGCQRRDEKKNVYICDNNKK